MKALLLTLGASTYCGAIPTMPRHEGALLTMAMPMIGIFWVSVSSCLAETAEGTVVARRPGRRASACSRLLPPPRAAYS
eukprot:scaffold6968_cov46-Phaeocystis_antarctica.AAC.3